MVRRRTKWSGAVCGSYKRRTSMRKTVPFLQQKGGSLSSMDEIVFRMDCLYNYLNYPYPGTNTRTFGQGRKKTAHGQERTKLMKDEELLDRHGDLGTFIVRVQHRQNSSWQGRITWMEENQNAQLPFDLGDGQADCQRGGYGRDGGRDGRRTVLVLENREAANACPGLHVLSISCKIQRKGTHSG